MAQINALTSVIVPAWFQRHSSPFRIWSAACATGEEPFTIAIALVEAGFGSHPIEFIASDASTVALAKARSGMYREKSFRALPQEIRRRYFEKTGEGWKLDPGIMKQVRFERINLLEPGAVAPNARVQAMFCRNVFIYFSPHSIRQTVAIVASRMPAGGCLFTGASESLLRMTTDFELKEIAGAMAYVRI